MTNSRFVYVTYIRTAPEKLWDALLKPEFTKQYWGAWQESDWKKGASWEMFRENGELGDKGEILEIDRPNKLVLSWRNEFRPELKAEGFSRATFLLEPHADGTKLTVNHEIDVAQAKFIDAVSNGWPLILSSLKSFLETGTPLGLPRGS